MTWGDRIRRHLPAAVAAVGCAAAFMLVLVASAKAARPVVDRGFGEGGRVVVRVHYKEGEGLELSARRVPGRRVQVVLGHQAWEYRADGRADQGFASGGRLDLAAGVAGSFEPSVLIPGADGGLVVGGTTSELSERAGTGQTWATVRRYLPSGRPDQGFASGGTLTSQFGFPTTKRAPIVPGAYEIGKTFYGGPHVSLSGLSADPDGSLEVEGEALIEYSGCGGFLDWTGAEEEFTARLTSAGAPDGSLGPEGIGSRELVQVPCDPNPPPGKGAGRQPRRDFVGSPRHARAIASASGTDAKGRTVLLVETQTAKDPWHLVRLTRAGRFDRSFGDDGVVSFQIPHGKRFAWISDIRVAPDGSVLLMGTIGPHHPPQPNRATDRLYLGKVTTAGTFAGSFGPDGFRAVNLGKISISEPSDPIELGHGQVVIPADLDSLGTGGYVLMSVYPGG